MHRHGDGVRDVALWVDDARRHGPRRPSAARERPRAYELRDEYGTVKLAAIAAYGDTIHTFVERSNYNGPFLPGLPP